MVYQSSPLGGDAIDYVPMNMYEEFHVSIGTRQFLGLEYYYYYYY